MGGWIEEEAVLKKSSQLKSCCAPEAQEFIYERIDLVVKMISIGLPDFLKAISDDLTTVLSPDINNALFFYLNFY